MIAILAGMLLPALNSAREKARQIQCVGNLKGLAQSWFMYAMDNRDSVLPGYVNSSWEGFPLGAYWPEFMLHYGVIDGKSSIGWEAWKTMTAARKLLICPTDPRKNDDKKYSGGSSPFLDSYGYNCYNSGSGNGNKLLKISQKNAYLSKTMLFSDGWKAYPTSSGRCFCHNYNNNYFFQMGWTVHLNIGVLKAHKSGPSAAYMDGHADTPQGFYVKMGVPMNIPDAQNACDLWNATSATPVKFLQRPW